MRRPRNNRSYFDAERRILSATGKILNLKRAVSIKVREISRAAGLANSSFYIHYHSLSDLIEKNEKQILSDIELEVKKLLKDETCSLEKGYRNILFTLYKHKNYLNVIIKASNIEVSTKVMKILRPFITKNWSNYGTKVNDIVFHHLSAVAIAEIILWRKEQFSIDKISLHAHNLALLTNNAPKSLASIYYETYK